MRTSHYKSQNYKFVNTKIKKSRDSYTNQRDNHTLLKSAKYHTNPVFMRGSGDLPLSAMLESCDAVRNIALGSVVTEGAIGEGRDVGKRDTYLII